MNLFWQKVKKKAIEKSIEIIVKLDETMNTHDEILVQKNIVETNIAEPVFEQQDEIIEDSNESETHPTSTDEEEQFILIDTAEVDKTLIEIANHSIKEEIEVKEEVHLPIEEETLEESLTNIDLDFLKTKKSKNIIDKAISIKIEELNELTEAILESNSKIANKATVRKSFVDCYIQGKYYNCFNEEIAGTLFNKIKKSINLNALYLLKNYKGKNFNYENTVKIYNDIFLLIASLEKANESITDNKVKNEFYFKELSKYYKNLSNVLIERKTIEIKKIQKKYSNYINYFLKSLDSNIFQLSNDLIHKKINIHFSNLKHNINFNRVYSDYIIEKTYNEGVISEDKIQVLLSLLSAKLLGDMFSSNFDKKYLIYIPSSLYTKEKKYEKTFKIIDDKYAKNNIFVLVTYQDILQYKNIIKNARKNGYRFVLWFDQPVTIKAKDKGNIYMATYIVADKKTVDFKKIKPNIPIEFNDRIIDVNMHSKFEETGGE